MDTAARRYIRSRRESGRRPRPRTEASQNVTAQVLILHDVGELGAHVRPIDLDRFLLQVGALERNLLEQFFHDRMETPRPDVLGSLVDLRGELGYFFQGVVGENQLDTLGLEQRRVL